MEAETWWFIWQVIASAAALIGGLWLGSGPRHRAWMAYGLAMTLMGVWLWLQHHPAVGVEVMPVHLYGYFEGTGAVPFFMFNMGVLWRCSSMPRQRRVAALAVCLGAIYFLNGGVWMLHATPHGDLKDDPHGDAAAQSRDFSCVAAACATALNRIARPTDDRSPGLPVMRTSEREMMYLTRTRPGFGSTIVRALEGLNYKLERTSWEAVILEVTFDELRTLPMPVLTPLQLSMARHHMVVVSGFLNIARNHEVTIFDPQIGAEVTLSHEDFKAAFGGQVIAFLR